MTVNPTVCEERLERMPDLPDSARRVFCHLLGHKPTTSQQIRAETGMARRTVYSALQRLREAGVLKEQISLQDSRQTLVWLDIERLPRAEPIQAEEQPAFAAAS